MLTAVSLFLAFGSGYIEVFPRRQMMCSDWKEERGDLTRRGDAPGQFQATLFA